MADIWVKNNHTEQKNWCGQGIDPDEYYLIEQEVELSKWQNNSIFLADLASGLATIARSNSGSEDISDLNEALNYLKGIGPSEVTVSAQPPAHPFASPDYRTKNNATTDIVTIGPDAIGTVDHLITYEKYVSGGTIIVRNAKFGDYVTASVYDKDNLIPESYRAALCEAHPVVARYIEKSWVEIEDGIITKHKVDTRPLNAKITPGLYLRVTYHATAEIGDRDVLVNYDLTVKL